jgi:hypothetical protein
MLHCVRWSPSVEAVSREAPGRRWIARRKRCRRGPSHVPPEPADSSRVQGVWEPNPLLRSGWWGANIRADALAGRADNRMVGRHPTAYGRRTRNRPWQGLASLGLRQTLARGGRTRVRAEPGRRDGLRPQAESRTQDQAVERRPTPCHQSLVPNAYPSESRLAEARGETAGEGHSATSPRAALRRRWPLRGAIKSSALGNLAVDFCWATHSISPPTPATVIQAGGGEAGNDHQTDKHPEPHLATFLSLTESLGRLALAWYDGRRTEGLP